MKIINYIPEQIVNVHGIKYIAEENSFLEPSGRKRRACLFKCHCGKEFISRHSDVISNKRTSCGCKKGIKATKYITGELINGVEFVKTLSVTKNAQRAIFKCPICNNHWESSVNNVKAGKSKSCCGVKRGWSKTQWTKLSKTAKLYKVRLYNETESFIKIGITINSVDYRVKRLPYQYEILKVIEGDSGYIFDLELKTKKMFKNCKYTPLIHFKGESECYTLNL